MEVIVNGNLEELPAAITLAQLLAKKDLKPGQVAIEHNGDLIKAEELEKVELEAKDQVEIISFVGGGS